MESVSPELEAPRADAAAAEAEAADTRPRPAVYRHPLPADRIDPDALKVIRRLTRHGHVAYLVGGGVRDLLLGNKPKDFDVATSARPQEVKRLFRNCRVIGRRFRLAHILFAGGKVIEVATFRRDPMQAFDEVEGELAEEMQGIEDEGEPIKLVPRPKDRGDDADLLIRHDNVFGEPHEDAIRRDFTINGLFYDVERGEVIDYVGGMPDLSRRVLHTIGNPDVRFREDPARILRAIKFSARCDLGLDPDLYDAMVDLRGELVHTARPRLFEELLRLMRGGAGRRSIYLTWDTGVLAVLLPELASFLDEYVEESLTWARLAAVDARFREGCLPSDAVLLAAMLLSPLDEAMEGERDRALAFDDFMSDIGVRLVVPRRLRERMRSLVTALPRMRAGRVGALPRREWFADAAILFAIDQEARGEPVPAWAVSPEVTEAPEGRSPGRRRRRSRRRHFDG